MQEVLAIAERLHAENERLRLRVLELLKLVEDEVTERVEAEFALDDWRRQAAALQAELDALRSTRLMRAAAPLRALYAKVHRRG